MDGQKIKFHNHISLKFNYLYNTNENLRSITSISVNAPNIFNVQSYAAGTPSIPDSPYLTWNCHTQHKTNLHRMISIPLQYSIMCTQHLYWFTYKRPYPQYSVGNHTYYRDHGSSLRILCALLPLPFAYQSTHQARQQRFSLETMFHISMLPTSNAILITIIV
jgi:hypothetical protein